MKRLDTRQIAEFEAHAAVLWEMADTAKERLIEQIAKDQPGCGWRNLSYPITSIFDAMRKDMGIIQQLFRSGAKPTKRDQRTLLDIVIRLAQLHDRMTDSAIFDEPVSDTKPKRAR